MSSTGSLLTKFNRALRPSSRRKFGQSRQNATLEFESPEKKKPVYKTVPELRLRTIKKEIREKARRDRIVYIARFIAVMIVLGSLAVWVLSLAV